MAYTVYIYICIYCLHPYCAFKYKCTIFSAIKCGLKTSKTSDIFYANGVLSCCMYEVDNNIEN